LPQICAASRAEALPSSAAGAESEALPAVWLPRSWAECPEATAFTPLVARKAGAAAAAAAAATAAVWALDMSLEKSQSFQKVRA